MAEALIAVAILVILFALLVPNLVKLQKDLRQKELDAKAEMIYVAVQNQMTKLRTSGNADKYAPANLGVGNQNVTPSDSIDGKDYYYFSSLSSDSNNPYYANLRQYLMTQDVVDSASYPGEWVIEYIYDSETHSATVYSVFYSEKDTEKLKNWSVLDGLRTYKARYDAGAKVGYYNGVDDQGSTGGSTGPDSYSLSPVFRNPGNGEKRNGEKLAVELYCIAPTGVTNLTFHLKITDAFGNVVEEDYAYPSPVLNQKWTVQRTGRSFSVGITLDDLSRDDLRFHSLYPTLTAGSNLTLELTATTSSGLNDNSPKDTWECNSLFADDSAGDTASIKCGRHLQNLDSGSGVAANVTKAVQAADINFLYDNSGSHNPSEWRNAYGDTPFQPIGNENLVSFDGGGKRIRWLNTDSGLFSNIKNKNNKTVILKNILLASPFASGSGSVGALAGTVSGACAVTNCGVYLDNEDIRGQNKKTSDYKWIGGSATAAGGLVGTVTGSLTVQSSYAATVLSAAGSAGGLVGEVSGGSLTIQKSYADCYITGRMTGGLVGGGSVAEISDCYAAGFLYATSGTGTTAAGLANGSVAQLRSSYTVCDLGNAKTTLATVSSAGSLIDVYYLTPGTRDDLGTPIGSMTKTNLAAALGDAFTGGAELNETTRYNLNNNGLDSRYVYPGLKNMHHYGDWVAGFQPGSLVYYEVYRDDRGKTLYGFVGGSVSSTLRDNYTLLGDGYGILLEGTTTGTVSVEVDGMVQNIALVSSSKRYEATDRNGKSYFIYPLDLSLINVNPFSFWHLVKITTSFSGSESEIVYYAYNPYLANTQQKLDSPAEMPSMPTTQETHLSIRSPRHLRALADHYDSAWSRLLCCFDQERPLEYGKYQWMEFSGSAYTSQAPIGGSDAKAFQCAYSGGCYPITGVRVVSQNGSSVGLFGTIHGVISDVVLVAEYNAEAPFTVKRVQSPGANETVYMGLLVGHNRFGFIENCAVAGYCLTGDSQTIYTYANSTVYIGGLVGCNDNVVQNSSVVIPEISVSALYSDVSLGGFIGVNRGIIRNSYCISHLDAEARETPANVAGFAGTNTGQITGSYCATAMRTADAAVSYGFAPNGGQVSSDSHFLSDGTYHFAGSLYAFGGGTSGNAGTSCRYEYLHSQRRTWQLSSYHAGTAEANYPFRAVVRNAAGVYIHYGDWLAAPELGTLGVFYWELEESGSNNGYHFSFLGKDGDQPTSGSTLCTAHDDGGVVTAYGYGYYAVTEEKDAVSLMPADGSGDRTKSSGICWNEGRIDAAAAEALAKQMVGYTFYPYVSGYPKTEQGELDAAKSYLYPDPTKANGVGEPVTNGIWVLAHEDGEGHKSYSAYQISPFFANALARENAAAPGSEGKPYEVRSVQQLQYINWNYETKDCAALVDGEQGTVGSGNYQDFPYLQYATVVGSGKQTKADATAKRPAQSWLQTHDLNGSDSDGYTPIAGKATSSKSGFGESGIDADRHAPLFAWFGGSYDGQSYKIQNLDIISDSYTVGLFGATVGATIQNIILYGDGTIGDGISAAGAPAPVVRRVTDRGTVNHAVGAYQIGGLVALAYDYSGSDASSTISNCAISGYVIDDSSGNQHGLGYASVGGLFGVSQVELDRCSAVADIQINYRSPKENGSFNQVYSKYGNMIRVGGLAGTALHQVSNCYTGGSVEIDDDTLNEKPWDVSGKNKVAVRDRSLQIFVGGIAGSVYKYGIVNFTGGSVTSDGTVKISNCYTYLTLPRMVGNVYAASIIVGPADRFHCEAILDAENCYYLQDRVLAAYDESFSYNTRDYTFKKDATGSLTNDQVNQILFGNLDCLTGVLFANTANKTHRSPAPEQQRALTYEQLSGAEKIDLGTVEAPSLVEMPGALGSAWGTVPIKENDNDISGKYSFSDDPSQKGKNYPFPAVIRQGDIYVHYGAWPRTGVYWTEGRPGMDIFADMKTDYAEKIFTLHSDTEIARDIDSFTVAPADGGAVIGVDGSDPHNIKVTLRALKPGSVMLKDNETDVDCTVSISAGVKLTPAPTELRLPNVDSFTVTAAAASGEDLTNLGSWTARGETTEGGDETLAVEPETGYPANDTRTKEFTIADSAPGDSAVIVTYTYDYHGTPLTATAVVPIRTLGYVGLSDGTAWTVKKRADGTDYQFETGAVRPTAPQGADVFLFVPASEGDLDRFTIKSVTAADSSSNTPLSDCVRFFETDGRPAYLSDGNYQYYCAALRSDVDRLVNLTVTLTDPVTGADRVLQLSSVKAYGRTVDFEPNGGEGAMRQIGYAANVQLPANGFSKTGYRFAGWNTDAAGTNGTAYEDLAVLTEAPEGGKLYAQWAPIAYTVYLEPNNNGEEEAAACTFYYDATELPDPTADNALGVRFAAPEGYVFDGWNTAANGTGAAYQVYPQSQKNLTELDGDEITLYAQWTSFRRLILTDRGAAITDTPFVPDDEATALTGYTAPAGPDGWMLYGWYTDDGVRVLDGEGTIVDTEAAKNVAGITENGGFKLTGVQTLMACWTRTAYVKIDKLDPDTGANGVILDAQGRSSCDGTYLIANGDTGAVKLMANTGGDTFKSADAAVIAPDAAHPVFDQNGIPVPLFILSYTLPSETSNAEAPLWTIRYRAAEKRSYQHPRFELLNKVNGVGMYDGVGYSLRDNLNRDGNVIQMKEDGKYSYNYGKEYNNRNLWTYGTRASGMMMSEFNDNDGKKGYTLGLKNDVWGIAANQTCSLFRLQNIYSFEPF